MARPHQVAFAVQEQITHVTKPQKCTWSWMWRQKQLVNVSFIFDVSGSQVLIPDLMQRFQKTMFAHSHFWLGSWSRHSCRLHIPLHAVTCDLQEHSQDASSGCGWHDNYAKYYFKQTICVSRQDFLNNGLCSMSRWKRMQLAVILSTANVQPPQETIILQRTTRHDLFDYFIWSGLSIHEESSLLMTCPMHKIGH